MKKILSAAVAALLVIFAINPGSAAATAITPLWLRDVRISPDGATVAFCYKGDIWSVPATGGEATRLTSQEGYDSNPVWSPDGTKIAFASRRKGGNDVFVMSAEGDPPPDLPSIRRGRFLLLSLRTGVT